MAVKKDKKFDGFYDMTTEKKKEKEKQQYIIEFESGMMLGPFEIENFEDLKYPEAYGSGSPVVRIYAINYNKSFIVDVEQKIVMKPARSK